MIPEDYKGEQFTCHVAILEVEYVLSTVRGENILPITVTVYTYMWLYANQRWLRHMPASAPGTVIV